jgi:myo-inositol-1(or 4)-monophosphatase
MCEWILEEAKFRPDILCYNILMDAYGRSNQFLETERVFQLMRRSRCLPNEDTFNVLLRAYGNAGLTHKAESIFYLMQRLGYEPGNLHIMSFNCIFGSYISLLNV